ncbi:MAG: SH3 domain-containing protein [Clostridiales bacterium]|nr:SH3 domain-containing protein [Candidatus Crickella equi]
MSIAMVLVMAIAVVGVSALTANSAIGKVNDNDVNLRTSSSTSSEIVTVLDKDTEVSIKSVVFKKKSNTAAKYKWYKVSVVDKNGEKHSGYIRSDYVGNVKYTAVDAKTSSSLNYRKGAGIKMKKVGTLKKGSTMKVLLKATPVSSTKGDSKTWYLIKYKSKKYYVCSKYVKAVKAKAEEQTDDTDKTDEDKKDEASEDKKDEDKKDEDKSGDKIQEAKPTVTVTGLVYPSGTITEGTPVSIAGTITSNYNIKTVQVGIVGSDGNWVDQVTKSPNAKTFNVASVDENIRFGILAAGEYKFKAKVTLDDSNATTKIAFNKKFTIKSYTSKTLTDETVNERIRQMIDALAGKFFTSDQKECRLSDGTTCDVENVLKKNSVVRELIGNNKGGKEVNPNLLPYHYDANGVGQIKGYSCCGFANFAGWYVAADKNTSNVNYRAVKVGCDYNYENMSMYARPGDIVRSATHSWLVVSVEQDGLMVLDSNWGHTCMVNYHLMGYTEYSKVTISRSSSRADS